MVADTAFVDATVEEDQATAAKLAAAIRPNLYSDDPDMERGITDPATRAQDGGNSGHGTQPLGLSVFSNVELTYHLQENALFTPNTELSGNNGSPGNSHSKIKPACTHVLWYILAIAPIMTAFNVIITTYKKPYFFWHNFIGYVLFDFVVMTMCIAIWTVIYGFVISLIVKRLFPRWWKTKEALSSESALPVLEDRAETS
jgi:hypothetical protein